MMKIYLSYIVFNCAIPGFRCMIPTIILLFSSVGSESAPHFNMSIWSWVRALTEAKEKGMGHAPIACEWDHPSSEWARGWGPYKKRRLFIVRAPPPGPLRRGVVPLTGYPPSSQGFLSPPWARSVGSGNYLEWVSKLMVPGSIWFNCPQKIWQVKVYWVDINHNQKS